MTEQQLRKALGAANDLEPPTDELFAQRALERGRARAARRRNAWVGAAASLALVGALGGTWFAGRTGGVASSTSAGGAMQAERGAEGTPGADAQAPSAPAAVAAGGAWITGPVTPQSRAIDELTPTLVRSYPDTFGGAYATDATNTHVVVTLTRPDPGLEALVTSRMPSPGDVSFALVSNSAVRKQEAARKVLAEVRFWQTQGVSIVGVRIDARADRVVVTVREPGAVDAVEQRYGRSIVRAEVGVGP